MATQPNRLPRLVIRDNSYLYRDGSGMMTAGARLETDSGDPLRHIIEMEDFPVEATILFAAAKALEMLRANKLGSLEVRAPKGSDYHSVTITQADLEELPFSPDDLNEMFQVFDVSRVRVGGPEAQPWQPVNTPENANVVDTTYIALWALRQATAA